MKKISALCIAVMAAAAPLFAQGGITPEMLSSISRGYTGTPAEKALRNALAGNSISVLAANAENAAMIDTHFSDRVKTVGITNQKSSGRCWLFTGLNVLRAKAIEKYDLGNFQFSQNYVFFWDQLEKANLFLQGVIDTRAIPFDDRRVDWLFKNPLSDGGQFTGVSDLISKYGLVPSSAMPETFNSNNTSVMRQQLSNLLRQDGLELRRMGEEAAAQKGRMRKEPDFEAAKTRMLTEVYHILCLCLGVPPTEFEWTRCNGKGEVVSTETYTPKSFYDKYVGRDLTDGYVMLMNDPTREYGKVYEISYDRHVYDGRNWLYVNLPIERIKEIAIASIKGGDAMYFSCDVAKFLDRGKGVLDISNFDYASLLGAASTMDKKERVMTHASGSSHAMTLIAVDIKDGKSVKWMVENSWGADSGYKGCLVMTDEWFDEYMFRLVAEKKYIPADIQAMLKQRPVVLPPWDPMFAPED
ncbi:MAG: C1 family peptidase [Bacteroidales bacterium]|nr:C1 family peptidase [Bacteroidales bacterium]